MNKKGKVKGGDFEGKGNKDDIGACCQPGACSTF